MKKEAENLKEIGKWYIEGFGGSKEKSEMSYNVKIFFKKEIYKLMNGIKNKSIISRYEKLLDLLTSINKYYFLAKFGVL